MAIYRFAGSPLVDEVTFIHTEKGGVRGYLHAVDSASPDQLGTLIQTLRDKKLEVVPYVLNHKPTLEVRGFSNGQSLIKTLTTAGAVSGKPKIDRSMEPKLSLWEQVRKRSLQASGISYLAGDYGFFRYGMKEADHLTMTGAIFYFLGTLALVGYGRNDQSDLQVHDMSKDLEHFLTQEKVKIPEASALHAIAKNGKKNLLGSLDEFCQRYPSEIFNTVTAMAGVFVAAAAIKHKILFKPTAAMDAQAIRKMHQEGLMDFGLGAMTTTSGMLATLVQEKKPDPDDPPTKGLAWVWEKIREHPLAIAGGGYTVSTMCHAASTITAYREARRVNDKVRMASVPYRGLFVGAAFLSEFLLAISSKGHGEGVTSDDSVDRSVYAIAAELIAKQPPENREWHIQHITGFLQQPNMMADSYDAVEKELRTQVALLEKNPWSCPTCIVESSPQNVTPVPQPAAQARPAHAPSSLMQPAAVNTQAPTLTPGLA